MSAIDTHLYSAQVRHVLTEGITQFYTPPTRPSVHTPAMSRVLISVPDNRTRNESVPIQPAQCWFPARLAISMLKYNYIFQTT